MTSNIGAQYLLEGIDEYGNIQESAEKYVINDLRNHFRPEFLNRLDETILFKPLTKKNIGNITDLIIKDLNKRLEEKEITVELSEEAKNFVVENGYDPLYGARPLKRFIQKQVETLVGKMILGDNVKIGETVIIDVDSDTLIARNK